MPNVAAKDNQTKILEAFQQILAERQAIRSTIATKEEEAEKAQNQQILDRASQYTSDSIVRGLADLQLDFSTVIGGLTTQLTTETTKLDELQRAIATETNRLQDLQQTRVVADALYLLTQTHQDTLRQLDQQATVDRQTLNQEIVDTRNAWQQEQAEFDTSIRESYDLLGQERTRQEEDYNYDIDRARTIAMDDYNTKKRQVERELAEAGQAKEKQWAERERLLDANQPLLEEYQRQADAFPVELDEAIKKAREDGIREVNQEAKVKADLLEKEWNAAKQGYELQIQSLELKIEKQMAQITDILTQLQTAQRQAQELAMRAFENSSRKIAARKDD